MSTQEGDGIWRETYAEFNNERYSVQNTPHVLWNGTRYAKGIKRKLIN